MWQMWLRHWIAEQAREQLLRAAREAQSVGAAAAGHSSAADAERQPGPSDPSGPVDANARVRCDVGLVFASAGELAGLEDRLEGVLEVAPLERGSTESPLEPKPRRVLTGGLTGRRVVAMVAGPGAAAAGDAARIVLEAHRPRRMIVAGFATALAESVKAPELILAERLVAPGQPAVELLAAGAGPSVAEGVALGSVLALDQIPSDRRERAALGAENQCLAATVGSLAAAHVCQQSGTPCLGLFVIFEGLDEQRPARVRQMSAAPNLARWLGGLAGAATAGQGELGAWWNWQERALECGDRLGQRLCELMAELPLDTAGP